MIPLWPEVIFGGHMDDPSASIFKLAYIFQDAARQAEIAGVRADYFSQLNNRVRDTLLKPGIDLKTKKLGAVPQNETWHIPHTAFLYAQKYGPNKGWEFAEAIFTRRFDLDGKGTKDVMTENVVEEIANNVGLDGKKAATAHASGEFDEIQKKYIKYGEEDGVFGVPFFSYMPADGRAKETFWGNDRMEFLLKAILKLDYLPSIPKKTLVEVQQSRL